MRRTLLTADHDLFRQTVRGVLERDLAPHVGDNHRMGHIPRLLWRALGEVGALGFMVPEAHGGGGTNDFRFNVVLAEELAAYGLAYASAFGINTDVVAPYLLELGTPEQHATYLPPFARGELVTAIAMTEPTAGSDVGALRSTATRSDGGWVLSGSKTFITNGSVADLILVAARTSPRSSGRGLSLFLVDGDRPGVSRRPLGKVGQHEADTAELHLDDVRLDDSALLGRLDHGFEHMMERLPQERISAAVSALAHARRAVERTIDYVSARQAFGRPISAFQNTRFVLADVVTRLDVTQAFVDSCVDAHCAGAMSAVDAAKAKYWATEVQGAALDACVQLHGGYGFMDEEAVARSWVDGRITRIWAGSNEIMREVIGRSLFAS